LHLKGQCPPKKHKKKMINDRIFTYDEIPYGELSRFGLTQEMIEDLPENVLVTISKGGRSPLLPMEIPARFGSVSCHAKFRLTNTIREDGTSELVFYPKLKEASLDVFSESEKTLLLEGKAIFASIELSDIVDSDHKETCYVQIDPDTNHVFYAHSSVIARNIRSMDSQLSLSVEDIKSLTRGQLVTIREPEFLTIGINLFTDTGVFVCHGDAETWKALTAKPMPLYSFGVEGCWINEDGNLHYIKEEDFDDTMEEARILSSRASHFVERESQQMAEMNLHTLRTVNENPQVTR